ncbi:MAG: membrane-bound lytic murein transglycosylase MltF [Nitrosomonadales bacterium]|nr:membrane-bound lytic murein transglycosylase MltF [Nitrosomonadales bacterium]
MARLFPFSRLLIAGLCAMAAACSLAETPLPAWQSGELVVIVPVSEMEADTEFELQLATLFAEQLKLRIKPLPLPPEQIVPALLAHKAHFAAAGLRLDSSSALSFGPIYRKVREQVVCGTRSPENLAQLSGLPLAVGAGTPQEAALRTEQHKHPGLRWKSRPLKLQQELLDEVATGKLECTVANQDWVAQARNFHPGLEAAFDLNTPSALAWAFPHDDAELAEHARQFFAGIEEDGTLRRLIDRYYGHNERLDRAEAAEFISKTLTDLPHYRYIFEQAATLTGQDWRLLAAVAYHESHWNPYATSRTNVRGIMMLTEDTADRLKVSNRLDARQSIVAGARYLQFLKDDLPRDIHEPDRSWFALAAYNQGVAHLRDARILAKKMNLDPAHWADVKQTLPLLSQPRYFKKLRFGKARGGEAVIMVEKIRLYHDMLQKLIPDSAPEEGFSMFNSYYRPLSEKLE